MLGRLGVPGLIVIAIIVVVNVLGGTGLDGGVGSLQSSDSEPVASPLDPARDPDAELVDFLSFVLDDVQVEWTELFRISGTSMRSSEQKG
jgi:predicted metalloprotease